MILDASGLESSGPRPAEFVDLISDFNTPLSFGHPNCADFYGFQKNVIQMVKSAILLLPAGGWQLTGRQ